MAGPQISVRAWDQLDIGLHLGPYLRGLFLILSEVLLKSLLFILDPTEFF